MISGNQLVKTIRDNCPDLHVSQLEPLGEGDFCHAYTDGSWVFRFAKHAEAEESLKREACLLPRIHSEFELQIPEPQYYPDTKVAGFGFVRYPKLSGEVLTRSRFLDLPYQGRDRCAAQLAQFISQLHACESRLAHDCGVPTCDYQAKYTQVLRRAECILFPLIDAPEQHYVETTITKFLNGIESSVAPILLHGDLCPYHVLYDPVNMVVTGVIDFGDMIVGDAAWDLTYLYEDYGVEFLRHFLKYYSVNEQREEVARAYRFHELDAIDWTVNAAETEQGSEVQEGILHLKRLRLQAKAPPWIELFE